MKQLAKLADPAYTLLRVISGAMFALHGAQKIFGFLSEHPQPAMWSQVWVGGVIELVGGLLILIGLQTRPAAFLSSGTMAVAYFQFHWKFQTGPEFFPTVNQGEMAVLYCLIFFYIACRGGGWLAIDKN